MGLFNDIIKRLADSYHPVGSIYITNSSTNPSTLLGGTWTCIKKSFSITTISDAFTFNSTNTTSGTQYLFRKGTSILFRLGWKTRVTLADSEVQIVTFSRSKAGLTDYYTPFGGFAQSDGSGAMSMIMWGSDILSSQDVITKTTATSVAAGIDNFHYTA